MMDMIGEILRERYELLEELGRGGMGVVYLARDPLLEREVAIKLVTPALLTDATEERLRREARVVGRMDHPAIVPVHDIGEHAGALFFVMPVVRGSNLRQRIAARNLKVGDVVELGIQVAHALQYSHELDVLHRDVKPENIMLSSDEGALRVRIMDFGLALHSPEDRLTHSGAIMGTPVYLSPEQVVEQDVDARSDIYSLATVLYECLAGEPPFRGQVPGVLYRISYERPRSLRESGIDVNPGLDALILRCLSKHPSERPESAKTLALQLEHLRGELTDQERHSTVLAPNSRNLVGVQLPDIPFTGREREFALVQDHLARARDGACQLVLLAGDIGVGKSRMLTEIELLTRARKERVLFGRFIDQDRGFPLYGFCDLILDYFRHKEASTDSSGPADFGDLRDGLVRHFPLLAEVPALRGASDPGTTRSPEPGVPAGDERTDVFELLARTLRRMLAGKPSVVLLEDLHQGDISIEALQYVVRRLGPTPCLIVGTYQSREVDKAHPLTRLVESFQGERGFSRIELAPLAAAEHRVLLQHFLGEEHVSDELARELFEVTDGNPFFTRELVRSLRDSGAIVRDGSGGWSISAEREMISDILPATVQQAVEKRVEGLSDELRSVLATASVLGRSFDFRDLEALADENLDVDEAVDQLLTLGLLEEQRSARQDPMCFVSGIVRDLFYSSLTRRRRRSLHRRYAFQLEERFSNELDLVRPQLLHHFSNGDVAEKVIEHGPPAARRALESFSPHEAVRAARTILDFLDDEHRGADPAAEGETRLLLAEAYRMARNTEAALKQNDRAVELFQRSGQIRQAVRAMLSAAETAWAAQRIDQTTRWVELGIETAQRCSEKESYPALLTLGATLANLRGEYGRGLELTQHARAIAAESEARDPAGEANDAVEGGRLVVALGGALHSIEPCKLTMNDESQVLGSIFENLVVTDLRGNLVPWLCESWEALEDSRSFLFALRRGITLQDGTPLTAEVVKASFERAVHLSGADSPPFLAAIRGAEGCAEGPIEGLRALDEYNLRIDLEQSLSIYPALLTCGQALVAHRAEDGRLVGTGPFQFPVGEDVDLTNVCLERFDAHWIGTAHMDEIEFRASVESSDCAAGLRSGEIDMCGTLLPEDLDSLLRDERFSAGFVEAPRPVTYFLLFNERGPSTSDLRVRQALMGVLRVDDLVWSHLGRLARPATGLIPPGILGHDPGRRRAGLSVEEARALLDAAGLELPLTLNVAVNPVFLDSFRPLWDAIQELWSTLGIEVDVVTDARTFVASWEDNAHIDLMLGRWIADYDDPDNFAYGLFHSRHGVLRNYFASQEIDELCERARAETHADLRQVLYHRFERGLAAAHVLSPLFHDIDYRVVGPLVSGTELIGRHPFVEFGRIHRHARPRRESSRLSSRGVVHVPAATTIRDLDPARARTLLELDFLPMVFETLTRVDRSAKAGPWLAEEVEASKDSRTYRVRLRKGVHFHDGRLLGARDVRYSFERLLRRGGTGANVLSVVRGSRELRAGEAEGLEGLRVVSPTELEIELEKPVSVFPQLLCHPRLAIVPEGIDRLSGPTRKRFIGTGAFRVRDFRPNERLEVAANPAYWRPRRPRCGGLNLYFRIPPEEIVAEFRAGRYSLAADLYPQDVDALRFDRTLGRGLRESPRPITAILQFNSVRGPLADIQVRRALMRAVDVADLVESAALKVATPTNALIPPGLLGHDSQRRPSVGMRQPVSPGSGPLELTAVVLPDPSGRYRTFADRMFGRLAERGVRVRVLNDTMREFFRAMEEGSADLLLGRWSAEYPDPDSFVHGLYDAEVGALRKFVSSKTIARLIDRSRAEADPIARGALFHEFERVLEREALVLPLFNEQTLRFARPELSGLRIDLFHPAVPYEELRLRE